MVPDGGAAEGSWLRRNGKTVAMLVILLGLAAFFRIAFNYDPAINDGNYRYAGNDDYYHWRVVKHVQIEGEHLVGDPLLNYPVGGYNPRPPVYDWHVAMEGQILSKLTGWDPVRAGAYALEWGSAFWGVLTIIPIWLIGRAVYSNKAGLWAAFMLAASPAHIQRAGFGLGDHDGFIVFWLVLGIYFLIRALQLTRSDAYYVQSWKSLNSIGDGFAAYIGSHSTGLAYAFLAGICWMIISLSWEGFPYAPAIFAVYYGFQLLTNQLRRRDSTGDVLVMLLFMGPIAIFSLPYYWTVGHVGATILSNAYILLGLLIATLLLVPTRNLPSIVVLPSIGLAGLASWLVLTFVAPDVGRVIFSANGYFNRSKLYSTIAEAQRTDLGVFVFSIGFMIFFLALVGFVRATTRFFRTKERDQLFIVTWGLVSIYMAFAAARFVFNAAPVFAILGGWMADRLVAWINFRDRLNDFKALRHESLGKAVRSTLGAKQVFGSLFIVVTLLVPSLWFSFDAGFPSEVRDNYRKNHPGNDFLNDLTAKRTGAFGQGFLARDWVEIYEWLRQQDQCDTQGQGPTPYDCPAHMAWWDYGFWEVALGDHPTVADNFQNGVGISGRFIAAQSEKEAVELLAIRLLEGHVVANQRTFSPEVKAFLEKENLSAEPLVSPLLNHLYDEVFVVIDERFETEEEAATFYVGLAQLTQTYIGYFLTDMRMMPLDFESTPGFIESGSIFYAPIFLANKNPDDFVQTVYTDRQNGEYRVIAYERNPTTNETQQMSPPLVVNAQGKPYIVSGGSVVRATEDGKRIDYSDNQGSGQPLGGTKLDLKPAFYNTMFYRGFIGGSQPDSGNYPFEFINDLLLPNAPNKVPHIPNAGKDLRHFRLVRETNDVKLLKFYLGASVTGTVTLADGSPIPDALVQVFDDFGIRHDTTTTDVDGSYELLAPFSLRQDDGTLGKIRVAVSNGGADLMNRTLEITEAQALRLPGAQFNVSGIDFSITPGSLDVFGYLDRDRDGAYNATKDLPARNAEMTVDEKSGTTDDTGHVLLQGLIPGSKSASGELSGYAAAPATGNVPSGGVGNVSVAFQATEVPVNGTLLWNNTGLAGAPVNFTAVNPSQDYTKNATAPAITDGSGNFTARLVPGGQYSVTVNFTKAEGGHNYTYRASTTVDVPIGSGPIQLSPMTATRTQRD